MATVDVTLSEGVSWPVEAVEADAARVLAEFGLEDLPAEKATPAKSNSKKGRNNAR